MNRFEVESMGGHGVTMYIDYLKLGELDMAGCVKPVIGMSRLKDLQNIEKSVDHLAR